MTAWEAIAALPDRRSCSLTDNSQGLMGGKAQSAANHGVTMVEPGNDKDRETVEVSERV